MFTPGEERHLRLTWHGLQRLEVGVEVEGGVAGEALPPAAGGDEGEALGLYRNPRPLHMLLDVPVNERRLASRVVS